MFVRYNPNPAGKNVGDCPVRAICKATGQGWHETYVQLCMQGLALADMPSANNVWGAYLKNWDLGGILSRRITRTAIPWVTSQGSTRVVHIFWRWRPTWCA